MAEKVHSSRANVMSGMETTGARIRYGIGLVACAAEESFETAVNIRFSSLDFPCPMSPNTQIWQGRSRSLDLSTISCSSSLKTCSYKQSNVKKS